MPALKSRRAARSRQPPPRPVAGTHAAILFSAHLSSFRSLHSESWLHSPGRNEIVIGVVDLHSYSARGGLLPRVRTSEKTQAIKGVAKRLLLSQMTRVSLPFPGSRLEPGETCCFQRRRLARSAVPRATAAPCDTFTRDGGGSPEAALRFP